MPRRIRLKQRVIARLLFLFIIPENACGMIQSQWYSGLTIALSHFSINQRYQFSDTAGMFSANIAPNVSKNVLGIGALGGYILKHSHFLIAGELSYLWDQLRSDQEMNFSQADGVFASQSTGAWQGLCHIGYTLHNLWTIYMITGIEFRRFRMQFYDRKDNLAARIDKEYNSFAFVPGIGIRAHLTKNTVLRGEYKISLHPSKSTINSAFNAISLEVDTSRLRQFSRIHTFQLGFVYNF